MIKKLPYQFKVKIASEYQKASWLTPMLIILLYFGGSSGIYAKNHGVDRITDVKNIESAMEDVTNYPKVIRSYNITDASTEGKTCFPTKGKGVIFQRADGCQGSHHIWKVADKLTLNEYNDDTATIIGNVTDENGKIGKVNIALYNKKGYGNTWQAQCYQEGVTDPRTLYQEFNGTITINGKAFSVDLKQAEQHYILADGAGFEPGRFGFGAWTGGTFGGCTEWFGNLDLIEVDCELAVNAGEDQESCNIEEIVLTANATKAADCANIIASYKIVDSVLEQGCFTADPGVIFTKGQNCSESLTIWSAQNDLMLNEYDNHTAKITGSVKNQFGKIGIVDVILSDKEYTGTTWSASCYLDGISGKETYYRSFNGTVTVDGIPMTVGTRFNAHYILANGAGFDSSQYGLGAWTGGSFGSCTEWFGNLVPKTIDNSDNTLKYMWTTDDGNIVGNPNQQSITVDKAGTYTVKAIDCESCEASDEVIVTMVEPKAHVLQGGVNFCIDGEADYITDTVIQVLGDAIGAKNTFVVTDSDGKILGLPKTFEEVKEIDFDGAGLGTCLLWNLSYQEGLQGTTVGSNANDLVGCFDLSASVKIIRSGMPDANAGEDVSICEGEEISLTATGGERYLWSTGETTATIKVAPTTTTTYSVTVISDLGCTATDEVTVSVGDKVRIGDYVWLDENRNGIQDDGNSGVKGVSVKLYHCEGDLVDSTMTDDEGYYRFEVCPDSGDYKVVFGDVPEGMKFTVSNKGSDTDDSDADAGGVTACFTITDKDDLNIDAGLVKICDIELDVVDEAKICSDETLELTATLIDNSGECEGGCVYPIVEQERCYGPEGDFEIWLVGAERINGASKYHRFKASEQRFETLSDGSARYTAKATDGDDNIVVEAIFTDYTTVPGPNGPKPNDCQEYDMSDWEYWANWSGTITSEKHGIFTLSMKGTYFQMGMGADVVRGGFGASGWFYAKGGDGYYVDGDINVVLEECIENNTTYKWTTENGIITGNANQKTIAVVSPGTYVIEAENCLNCNVVKKIVVTPDILCSRYAKARVTPKMTKAYPVPVKSGGTLTINFDVPESNTELNVVPLKTDLGKGSKANKESMSIVMYDLTGRVVSTTRTFDIYDGKAVIHLDIDHIPSGKYIVKAMSGNWSDSRRIIVE